MKILVLGNGFDKIHGLPTSYKDFIIIFVDLLFSYSIDSSDIILQKQTLRNNLYYAFNDIHRGLCDSYDNIDILKFLSSINFDDLLFLLYQKTLFGYAIF